MFLLFKLVFLLLQACSKNSCCSKLAFLLFFSVMFLLFQGRILAIIISHVVAAPSSRSSVVIPSCVFVVPSSHLGVVLHGRILLL